MSKRKNRNENADNTQSGVEGWLDTWWVPPSLFLLFTLVYFIGFVFSSDVMQGLDTRAEFYLGKEPVSEKIADLAPENWDRYLGGTPVSGFRQPKYFPLYPIYAFTTYHRYLGWRYFFSTLFAGYFTYLCVRGLQLRRITAAFSGIAYASSPTLLTFIYPGQEGKMLVMGIFPLMVWSLYRLMDTRRPVFVFLLALGVACGIYTPHLQMLYYALIGLGILFGVRLIQTYLEEKNPTRAAIRSGLTASGIILGLAVGAVGTFPAYQYTKTESRRAGDQGKGVSVEYAQSWSLHPEEIASLIVPEFVHFYKPETNEDLYWGRNTFKLNAEYFGIVALFFAILAIARVRSDKRVLPLLLIILISMTFSLGPHTPVFLFFYTFIPGMNVLRSPGMIAFLFAFPAILLAAMSIDRLLAAKIEDDIKPLAYGGGAACALLGICALSPETVLSAWNSLFWSDIPPDKLTKATANLASLATGSGLGLLWVGAITVLTIFRIQGRIQPAPYILALLAITLLDTWRIDKQYLRYVDPDRFPDPEVFIPQTINTIKNDTGHHRTWVPANDVQIPNDIDLLTVDYHEPFILRRYDAVTKHVIQQIVDDQGDATLRLLNALNVKYVAIGAQQARGILPAFALPTQEGEDVKLKPGITVVSNERNVYLFRNENARPFFYLAQNRIPSDNEQASLALLTSDAFDAATDAIIEGLPSRIDGAPTSESETVTVDEFDAREGVIRLTVTADQPRTLIVSQNYHPYWSADINGNPAEIRRANFVWQGIDVPSGKSTVTLTYQDALAEACRWISLISTIALVVGLVVYWRKPEPQSPQAA